MKLAAARINFRHRTGWEAIDLGFKFAGKYRLILAVLWLLVALPWFILAILIFWQCPEWIGVFLWWLKPVFEGSSLSVLSITVFEDAPPFKQALKEAYKQVVNPRLIGDLTWRRLSSNRSLFLPVKQLEQLKGKNYRNRKKILAAQISSAATTLTIIGSYVEAILYLGLWAIIVWFLTYTVDLNFEAFDLADFDALLKLSMLENVSSWIFYASAIFYLLIQSFWGPIYVACGFSLYLNARSDLEAWDIELIFRRLAARLSSGLLLLVGGFIFLGSVPASFAQAAPSKAEAERVRDQIINHKPFSHLKIEKKYCYKSCDQTKKAVTPESTQAKQAEAVGGASSLLTTLLWGFLVIITGLSIWYFLRDPTWIAALSKHKRQLPKVLFEMEVSPESLPDNVAETAAGYFDTQPRLALGLLYRASLSQLMHRYALALRNGNTENEVLCLAQKHAPATYPYLSLLTDHWIHLAYGHQIPPAHLKEALCQGYQRTFPNIKNAAGGKIKAERHA